MKALSRFISRFATLIVAVLTSLNLVRLQIVERATTIFVELSQVRRK